MLRQRYRQMMQVLGCMVTNLSASDTAPCDYDVIDGWVLQPIGFFLF